MQAEKVTITPEARIKLVDICADFWLECYLAWRAIQLTRGKHPSDPIELERGNRREAMGHELGRAMEIYKAVCLGAKTSEEFYTKLSTPIFPYCRGIERHIEEGVKTKILPARKKPRNLGEWYERIYHITNEITCSIDRGNCEEFAVLKQVILALNLSAERNSARYFQETYDISNHFAH
jgi:hypothetical protein